MNIPDLIDGFISWQSTLPCRTNQETPFVDGRVFQNRGVCGQAFPSLPSPPLLALFLRLPQFSRVQKAKSSANLRKAQRKRLLRRLLR